MPVQAGLPDGRTGAVGRRHTRTVPLSSPPLAITGLPSRSIPTAIALVKEVSVNHWLSGMTSPRAASAIGGSSTGGCV